MFGVDKQDAVLDANPGVRLAAAETMGMLTSHAGSAYLSAQIQWLVDQVVNNRIPESRAGCALAFGSIYKHVGGLAGGPILKTIVNILMSLATDPHPVVHYWSMSALAQVVNSASLSYSPYMTGTLGMVANIYLLESHEPDGGSLTSANLKGDLPAYQVICRLLQAIIGVLGPELQEPGKIRSLVFLLVHEFGEETDEGLVVEAIKCVQQFLMFAPTEVDIPKLLETFRLHLGSTRRPLKVSAITALYQIVQRDAVLISKLGGNQLVEDLFGLLDIDPSLEGVRNVITSWLGQTAASLPSGWIDLCQRIMTRTAPRPQSRPQAGPITAPAFIDDEGESLGAESTSSTGLTSRWRTQLFALECLHHIIKAVATAGRPEHFDPVSARNNGLNSRQMLYSRVGDLIRMAFSASAALVMDVRLQGLVVLRDVIEVSQLHIAIRAQDQHSSSALLNFPRSRFRVLTSPRAASGSHRRCTDTVLRLRLDAGSLGIGRTGLRCVCGVGSGERGGQDGKDFETPHRCFGAVQGCVVGSAVFQKSIPLLRSRLIPILDRSRFGGRAVLIADGEMVSLGEVSDLSPNASVMLKISILAAWAELQISSQRQAYLNEVTKPYRWLLGPFWVGSLRDYAGLRTDPDMGAGSLGVDNGVGRDILLPVSPAIVLHSLFQPGPPRLTPTWLAPVRC